MIAWLLAILLMIVGPATSTESARRLPVRLPNPPSPMPVEVYDHLLSMTYTDGQCTRTRIDNTVVTATHCILGDSGWTLDGDVAYQGPPIEWVDPAMIPVGSTIYGVGYPRNLNGQPVGYTLAALKPRTVPIGYMQQRVLMTLGNGIPCTAGTSGTIGWVTIENVARPVGPLSVGSVDPAVTSLPPDQYVCGFAI